MTNVQTWMLALAERGSTLELDVFDVISEYTESSAKRVRERLKAASTAKQINVRVNSRGGDVLEGLAIYNLLKQHRAQVAVEIVGLAASMAGVIAMAGDEISMHANAYLMLHNPHGLAIGESDDMRKHADLLDKMRGQLADIYVARTGLKRDRVLSMMDAETWLDAEEAKRDGFVNKIVPAKGKSKALAAVSLSGFSRVPTTVMQAVACARNDALEADGVPTWNGQQYHELKPAAKAQLKSTDPALFARMQANPGGQRKAFSEMRPYEKALLKKMDPSTFAAMQGDPSLRWRVPA